MSKLPADHDSGHTRLYGLFQTVPADICKDRDCDCLYNPVCIAVFPTKGAAHAFKNLQIYEQWERIQARDEQIKNGLRPREQPIFIPPHREWAVHSLIFDPQNTGDLYQS